MSSKAPSSHDIGETTEAVASSGKAAVLPSNFLAILLKSSLAVILLYGALFAFVVLRSDETINALNIQLASETIKIVRSVPLAENASSYGATVVVDDAASGVPATENILPVAQSDNALPLAPIPEVSEKNAEGGILPVISSSGLTPFTAYKRNAVLPAAHVPVVAIAIADFGLSTELSRLAVQNLPPDVTFLASVYSETLDQWVQSARTSGHEVWLEVPFETETYPSKDSGPYTLLKRSSLRLNQDLLEEIMVQTTGYAGLWGVVDGVYSGSPPLLKGFFEPVFARGLGYLETSGGYSETVEMMAVQYKAPYIRPSILIGGDKADQDAALQAVIQTAKDYGRAVGTVPPTPATLEALPAWIEMMKREGVVLVPVSAIFERAQAQNYN
jgi:polysaccharide deacetylase 2 family uncharacterized protein YibQ